MNSDDLAHFISKKMQMQAVYQPVMLIELLKNGGACSDEAIARQLTLRDLTQVEHYRGITNRLPGKVLMRHGIVRKERGSVAYQLVGYEDLTHEEIHGLIDLCLDRLNAFVEKSGNRVYEQGKEATGYVAGSLEYEAFVRGARRCPLCDLH